MLCESLSNLEKFERSFESNNRNNLNKHLKAEHKGNKPAGAAKNSGKKSPSGKVKCPKCPYSAESSLVGRHLEGAHGGVACKECKLVVESREEAKIQTTLIQELQNLVVHISKIVGQI